VQTRTLLGFPSLNRNALQNKSEINKLQRDHSYQTKHSSMHWVRTNTKNRLTVQIVIKLTRFHSTV